MAKKRTAVEKTEVQPQDKAPDCPQSQSIDGKPLQLGQRAEVKVAASTKSYQDQILERYQYLVDEKYLRGLTEAESQEMDRLGQQIDGFFDRFYEPVMATLKARLRERESGR